MKKEKLTDDQFLQFVKELERRPDYWQKIEYIVKQPILDKTCILSPYDRIIDGITYHLGFTVDSADKAHEIGNFYVIINKDLRNSALQKDIQIRLKLCKTQIEKVYLIEEELNALERKRQYPTEEYQQGYSNIKRKLNPFKSPYPRSLNWWKNTGFFSIGILNQVTEGAADCELEMYLIDLVEKIKTGHPYYTQISTLPPLPAEFNQDPNKPKIEILERYKQSNKPRATKNVTYFDDKTLKNIWLTNKMDKYYQFIKSLSDNEVIKIPDDGKPIFLLPMQAAGLLYNLLEREINVRLIITNGPTLVEKIKILNNTFLFKTSKTGTIKEDNTKLFNPNYVHEKNREDLFEKIIKTLRVS